MVNMYPATTNNTITKILIITIVTTTITTNINEIKTNTKTKVITTKRTIIKIKLVDKKSKNM